MSALRDTIAARKAKARWHREMANALDAEVAALEARDALTGEQSPGSVTGNMVTTHRLAISKGRTGKDPFSDAYRARGFTLRTLGKRLGIPHSLLSMYRQGVRPCPRKRAEHIERLIGWPADDSHWPLSLVS